MLSRDQVLAAELLARMPSSQRANAERLGFVALGLRFIDPSYVAATIDITPEILAEEARLRTMVEKAVAFDI